MYARLHSDPDPAALDGRPGLVGYYAMEQLGTGAPALLSLWAGDADAAQPAGPAGEVYEVERDFAGVAAAEAPQAASVLLFDGPISQAKAEAARRGSTDRIQPALRNQPGIVRVVTLWDPEERKAAVVSFATSLAELEAGGRAVNATQLLPDEDPVLLTGPDHVAIHRVTAANSATSANSARETVS